MSGTDAVTPVFPAGYGPVVADFTTWVTAPFSFLTPKVMFRGELHAAQSMTGGASTIAHLDTILEDPYTGWSATATGSQAAWSWLCPPGCSGWYEVSMTAFTNGSGVTTDQLQAILFVDGVAYQQATATWGGDGHQGGSSGAVQVPLLGGVDYVSMAIFSSVTEAAPATAGQYPTMELAWIST